MSITHLADLADPARVRRLVIKVGSALLVDDAREVRRAWVAALAGEIAEAVARGQQVVVVSSGAIALGAGKLGFDKGGRAKLADAQAAAAVGQIALAGLWAEELARHGYKISPGTLYPMLHKMARDGYFASREVRDGRTVRKLYSITGKGLEGLALAKERVREFAGEAMKR